MSLMEVHFPRTSLSTNAHSVVCRAKYDMEMMGALLMELEIERTVSCHSLLSIITCLITSYHANAIPYTRLAWCFMFYVLCSSLYNPRFTDIVDWEVQEIKRGSIKIMQTMVNDLMTEMQIRWWKSRDLYQPIFNGGDERTKFMRDRQGDGPARPSQIRMLGVSRRCCEDTYTLEGAT